MMTFFRLRFVVLTLFIATSFSDCFPQSGTASEISGVVRDLNTHREIAGVNILIKGRQAGTSSDHGGRFTLRLPASEARGTIIFRHIAYEPLEMSVDSLSKTDDVFLQPRVIPLPGVAIEEEEFINIKKDLPQTLTTIEAKNFEIRGYVDAGDLLRTDHSVQIDEELSGQKTVAIRGGNSDDVVVLYNGIKMNNAYDNIFDLSLIDLEDVERFEIIKGSNTSLYGPEAFSGVINIVPKVQQNYNIRFQQRLGTYRSGNWGLHLYNNFKGVQVGYNVKQGGLSRRFSDTGSLENSATHHTGSINYEFDDGGALTALGIYTDLNYENRRDNETLDNKNQMYSLRYRGDILMLERLDLSVSYRRLDEEQFYQDATQTTDRVIEDEAVHVDAQKQFNFSDYELLLGYQFRRSNLDFLNDVQGGAFASGLRSADFRRQHHGLVAIGKYFGDTGSDFFESFNLEGSFRFDRVSDEQANLDFYEVTPPDLSGQSGFFKLNDWQDTIVKLGASLEGYRNNFAFEGFLNFGSNTKFPTLFQQVNDERFRNGQTLQPELEPERTKSFELGGKIGKDLRGESSIYGLSAELSYFQTYYDSKFREIFSITPGLSTFENVFNARISGFESKSTVYFLRKKVTFELGLSRYFISDRTAFPFKSEHKQTVSLTIDHMGYSLQVFGFREGDQIAVFRQRDQSGSQGQPSQIPLSGYRNLDLHLSKTFQISRLKLFANASVRNVLNDDEEELLGLSIRDRRFYITLGAQY